MPFAPLPPGSYLGTKDGLQLTVVLPLDSTIPLENFKKADIEVGLFRPCEMPGIFCWRFTPGSDWHYIPVHLELRFDDTSLSCLSQSFSELKINFFQGEVVTRTIPLPQTFQEELAYFWKEGCLLPPKKAIERFNAFTQEHGHLIGSLCTYRVQALSSLSAASSSIGISQCR